MGRLLSRFGIGVQVGLIGAVALFGFVLVGMLYSGGYYQRAAARAELDDAIARRTMTDQVVIGLLQLRRAEKDFFLRHDDKYVTEHTRVAGVVTGRMNGLATLLSDRDNQSQLQRIRDGVAAYLAQFGVVSGDVRAIGLTEEAGLRGSLRRTVHDIETKVDGAADSRLLISMLLMRRHEKDFLERQDVKYAEALKLEAAAFSGLLQKASLAPGVASALEAELAKYQQDFTRLVEAVVAQQRDTQKLSAIFQETEPRIESMLSAISDQSTVARSAYDAGETLTNRLMAIGFGSVAIITVVLAWMAGRGIARPVVAMTAAMGAIAGGNKTMAIPGQGRGDEVGAMANAVAVFRDNMIEADRLNDAQAAARVLKEQRQAAIDQHTQDFGSSISGVMASLAESAGVMRQAADVTARASASVHEQAAETAAGATRSSQDLTSVAAAVEQMTASIEEIARQVASASEIAREAVRQAETGQTSIRLLADSTSRIGDVVSLISNIAGQTNLLALNATIEAARAGEAGKGFAVVAGEVKALAAQTSKATTEIGDQISAVQNATDSAISVMDQIGSVIARVESVSAAIAAAVEEQSVTTREIASSVQAVTDTIKGAARSMDEVVNSADEAGKVGQTMTNGADEIGRQAGLLRSEVDQFLQAVQAEDGDNRRYERLNGNGIMAAMEISGKRVDQVAIQNISRGGVAVESGLCPPAGTEVRIILPGGRADLAGRVARTVDGILAIVLRQDETNFANVDRFMDTLRAPQAA